MTRPLLLTAAEVAAARKGPVPEPLLLATAAEARVHRLVTATSRAFRATPFIAPHRAAYEMA